MSERCATTAEDLNRFRAALRRAPVVLFAQDRDLRYTWVYNPVFADADEILGKTDADLLPPSDAAALTEIKAGVLRTGVGTRREVRLETPAGVKHYDLTVEPTRDADGQITGVACTALDITERVEAETARREGEERLRLAQDAAGIGIHDYNPVTGHIRWCERVRALWGIGPDEPVTFDLFLSALHPDDRGPTRAAVDRALDPGGDGWYHAEYRVTSRRDGVERWVVATGAVTFVGDRAVRLVGTVHDVTDRKRAEEKLRRNADTFSGLVRNSPFGVYVVDAEFRLWEVSAGTRAVFAGIDPLIGRDFAEVLRIVWEEPFASEAIGRFRHTLATGEPYHAPTTTERRHNTGAVESYDWKVERIVLPDGRFGAVCHFYDLSERLSYEAALRASEERLRLAMAAAAIGMWDWDVTTGAVEWSPECYSIHGLREGEFDGTAAAFDRLVHPDDRDRVWTTVRAAVEQRTVYECEFRIVQPDGAVRWVTNLGRASYDEQGRPVRMVGTINDVTDRKRAEAALRASEQRFRLAADAVNGIIYDYDPRTGRVERTRGLSEVLGYHPDEVPATGAWWWEQIHPDDRPATTALSAAAVPERSVTEYRVRHKDGRWLHVEDRAVVLRGAAGEPVRMVGCTVDVTDRKAAEVRAREQAALIHTITDNATTAIFMMDDKSRCTFMNPAAERMTGFRFAEVEGRILHDLIHHHHPDGRPYPMPECPIDRALPEHFDVVHHEDVFIRKSGEFFPVLVNAKPVRKGGAAVATVIEVRDVTAEKRAAEANAGLVEQLREADRRKNEFLATLAHELRNPLAPIRNAVQILTVKGPPDPDLARAHERIDRQVRVMARLLDDLLDVSRITRGKLELRTERVGLGAVVAAAVETSRPLIDAAGHELVVALPPEPVHLDADPVRLAQVFANLLNNAAKYTDKGGHLRLTAERAGDEVVVTVADDGIGLAADMLPRLFEIFAQAGPALERSQGGLGIGLSLVRGLVELHGGTIEAHSDGPGRGSTFTVRLPGAGRAAPRPAAPPPEPRRAPKCRLLVADDLRDSADSLAELLALKGHEVRTAYGGEQAVAAAGEFRPDVVLLDLGMPQVSGFDACRRIREQPWGRGMCLVAMTGWGQDEDRRRTAAAGFDHHLVKPVDPAALEALFASRAAPPERAAPADRCGV